jgi:hypothetical protein|tara:strand:+ start:78 stop:512 length:435 start_codon:yes stop_codon:yes gene_type:complete
MGASKKIMKAAVGGSTTKAQGGFSPVDMLAGKFPENTNQTPSYKASGGGILSAAGGGIPKAFGLITGGRGKATFSGGSFNEMDKKENIMEDKLETPKANKDFDFDFYNVKKKLLEKAKEEKMMRQNQFTKEKEVYNQSLPNSVK